MLSSRETALFSGTGRSGSRVFVECQRVTRRTVVPGYSYRLVAHPGEWVLYWVGSVAGVLTDAQFRDAGYTPVDVPARLMYALRLPAPCPDPQCPEAT